MECNRRNFIKSMGLAAGAGLSFPSIVPSKVLGEKAPSKRITLGFIGVGAQGVGVNLKNFLPMQDAQVLAVCDAYKSRAQAAAEMVNQHYGTNDCKVHQDFRRIMEDRSIDAVVISTPDHWHVPMSMMAFKAGKDVFCEKPTYCINEGRELVREAGRRQATFQAGVEDRSLIHYHKMVEWVKNGAIGKLQRVEVTLKSGKDNPAEAPVTPPADLVWNLWLGPAPYHEFTPNRTGMWHWRYIRDYAKGHILDWGAHLVDTAQLGVNAPDVCPVEVEGSGMIPVGRMSDVPVAFDLNYRYSNGVEMHVKDGGTGIKFIGETGWVCREKWGGGLTASDPMILRTRYTPETTTHWPLPPREQRNFLDCVKSRKPATYTALALHQMSTTLHMGDAAIVLGRKLTWDPAKEQFIGDDEANRMCERPVARDWEKEG